MIRIKKNETTVLVTIMFAVLVVMVLANPGSFLTVGNFQGMAFQLPELGILSLAMMVVMITEGMSNARNIAPHKPHDFAA